MSFNSNTSLRPSDNQCGEITARVVLDHYRYPRGKAPVSGEFAIVFVRVEEVLSGTIPESAMDRGHCICVRGKMPRMEEGMNYFFQGSFVHDPKWGDQYAVKVLRLAYDLSTPERQRKFLQFFLTSIQVDALFEKFENPVQLLANKDFESLTSIKGIGLITAQHLCEKYDENVENGRAYIELQDLGLTKNALDKLIAEFKSPDVVVDLIKENPYRLITLVKGYGWARADAIARKQGFASNCPERVIAYARYCLNMGEQSGNSCVDAKELVVMIAKECAPISNKEVVEIMKTKMVKDDDFLQVYEQFRAGDKSVDYPEFYYNTEKKQLGTFRLRVLEQEIERHLIRLKEAKPHTEFDKDVCEKIIKDVEAEQGYTYTYEQRNAIYGVLTNNLSIITGRAGCGKSSTLKPLVRIFEHYGLQVGQCALSGRAASLLTEYTGLNGKTIHRLLQYVPDVGRFKFDESNNLSHDVIILDETSMVDEELFNSLIRAIRSGSKLVMLGDTQQLPPIGVGNLLNDCIKSGYIPTFVLTVIQRQAQKSGIITQSLMVCDGKRVVTNDFVGEETRGELRDFKVVCQSEAMLVHAKAMQEYHKLVFKHNISPDDIQLVVPMRVRGQNCCRMFNHEIQTIVNSDPSLPSVDVDCTEGDTHYTVTYRQGDRIMIIHNNYQARTADGKTTAIFNGNMGHIKEIEPNGMVVTLDDRDDEECRDIVLPRGDWGDITHAWCATCHKLQGSQAKYVIVVVDNGAFSLLIREWLYTALTRARKYCVLVGQPGAINTAVRNSNTKVKQTWLKDELYHKYLAEQGVA